MKRGCYYCDPSARDDEPRMHLNDVHYWTRGAGGADSGRSQRVREKRWAKLRQATLHLPHSRASNALERELRALSRAFSSLQNPNVEETNKIPISNFAT